MGNRAYLSPREKAELVEFVAAVGQSYERYKEWCGLHHVTNIWTQNYFNTWVQRRRPKVIAARTEHQEHVKKQSTYDKERRLFEYERDLELVNKVLRYATKGRPHDCPHCKEVHEPFVPPEQILKLLDIKRKHLESVAKERGEWMRPESTESNEPSARERLRLVSTQLLAEAQETKVVEGTYVVVGT